MVVVGRRFFYLGASFVLGEAEVFKAASLCYQNSGSS